MHGLNVFPVHLNNGRRIFTGISPGFHTISVTRGKQHPQYKFYILSVFSRTSIDGSGAKS